jgi:hypothetical protein
MAARNLALIAVAGLAIAAPALAQDKPMPVQAQPVPHNHGAQPAIQGIPADQAPADAPRITFDNSSHDFGVITDDNPVTHKFVFTNTGKSTLTISNVQGSCGCTVPALAKKDYLPGESGEITVAYNPNNRRGKQHTNVTVTSNDPVTPSLALQVHTDIKPLMYVEPQNINFGQATRGRPLTTTVHVFSRNADLKPQQATCSNPNVTARLLDPEQAVVEGDTLFKYPLEVSVASTAEIGPIIGTINIRTSDPARFINMQVNAEIVGDYAVAPMRMQFLNVQPAAPITSTVRVTSRSGKPFKITGADEVPGAPSTTKLFNDIRFAEVEGSKPQAWTITVSGAGPEIQTGFRGELIVRTDAPDEPTFKIPYNGYVSAAQAPQARFNNPTGAPVDPWAANPSSLIRTR